MLGVILCGGKSTRMNSDKGMLTSSGNKWVKVAADKVSNLNIPLVVSVNITQHNDYSSLFVSSQLITDNETLKIKGPLCGVLSVHLQYPLEDLLVLACDMPLMDTIILNELLNIYKEHSSADAFVFTNDGEVEPLCGIYTAKGLAYILKLYREDKLIKHSMKFMIEHINSFTIPITEEQKKYFKNINTHAELNGL